MEEITTDGDIRSVSTLFGLLFSRWQKIRKMGNRVKAMKRSLWQRVIIIITVERTEKDEEDGTSRKTAAAAVQKDDEERNSR